MSNRAADWAGDKTSVILRSKQTLWDLMRLVMIKSPVSNYLYIECWYFQWREAVVTKHSKYDRVGVALEALRSGGKASRKADSDMSGKREWNWYEDVPFISLRTLVVLQHGEEHRLQILWRTCMTFVYITGCLLERIEGVLLTVWLADIQQNHHHFYLSCWHRPHCFWTLLTSLVSCLTTKLRT